MIFGVVNQLFQPGPGHPALETMQPSLLHLTVHILLATWGETSPHGGFCWVIILHWVFHTRTRSQWPTEGSIFWQQNHISFIFFASPGVIQACFIIYVIFQQMISEWVNGWMQYIFPWCTFISTSNLLSLITVPCYCSLRLLKEQLFVGPISICEKNFVYFYLLRLFSCIPYISDMYMKMYIFMLKDRH